MDAGATDLHAGPADRHLPGGHPGRGPVPAYPAAGTPFGGTYTGTLTAPQTGNYVLAITNPCGCYTSTYLRVDGKDLIDNPSTPPVHTYSAAVNLTAGTKYTLSISGASSQLLWATRPTWHPVSPPRLPRRRRPPPRWWSSPTTPSPRPPTGRA